jgi:hypothetical protein
MKTPYGYKKNIVEGSASMSVYVNLGKNQEITERIRSSIDWNLLIP